MPLGKARSGHPNHPKENGDTVTRTKPLPQSSVLQNSGRFWSACDEVAALIREEDRDKPDKIFLTE